MDTSASGASAAVNRFGLGPKPGELARAREPRAWLEAQLADGPDGTGRLATLPSSIAILRTEVELGNARRAFRQSHSTPGAGSAAPVPDPHVGRALQDALRPWRMAERRGYLADAAARYRIATVTDTPFVERLVHFWSNHFAVSVDKRPARLFAAPMEREAIRPHVTGRFIDLLLAVETHPAMLLYLDNVHSTGPDSPLGRRIAARLARAGAKDRGKAGGLNENLGREAMELHTVGVAAGYTQADVTEFARALTGWSIPFRRDFAHGREPASAFLFRANAHEPGVRHVLGHAFPAGGFEQGRAIFEFLARQPATANHLASELARHFVSDHPPPSLVERLAKSYLEHDTDLAAVYRTLVASPEAWAPDARKFKAPQDFVVSALRAGQIDFGERPQPILALLRELGQPMFEPRSPAGFTDDSASWIDADGLWKRVQAAEALAAHVAQPGAEPVALARAILGPSLDADTLQAIARAESVQQAHATLFACPAFQWRA